ncbi:uncharacterized protein Z519_05921 [Cladophialophora bantiana CBS 173.52]|uniref:peptidylprolyl isomerase n=1 Tax=Cladophialophora bantiana (strain ATCC 10958 / CBS 173.52 / CDC B-1940 / NIH 8579) TaxID=1442370 RepID=A0A0D2ETU6_CLAB1|nr:uncharacterized protein Z519_05921 [Cladophialophora bantiana CBS 173.52]KIW93316.1 hypothetical protein Z519_05921 [Cladophialophora bantiana CBS 173.52]
MASYVYFKFKSQKEPQRVTIDGPHTDVWNLKREIINISRLGDGTDFDLKIYKENSNEEYTDDTEIIPKDSTVLARRLPASAPGKGRAARYVSGKPPISAKSTATSAAVKPRKTVDMAKAMTEQEKLQAMLQVTDAQWQQKQEEMSHETRVPMQGKPFSKKANIPEGEPPHGYICYRCGKKGHWIQACPTNDDASYDNKNRIKRTTGIPRSMLKKIDQADIDKLDDAQRQNLMVNAEGEYVFAQADEKAWRKHLEQVKAAEAAQKKEQIGDKELQDRGLECSIDKRLFVDPMKTPCCGKTYCHVCIENALLENDLTCPGCETENISLERLEPDEEMKNKIKEYEAEKTAEKERSRSPTVVAESPKAKGSPGSRPSSRDGSGTPQSASGSARKRSASEVDAATPSDSLAAPAMKRQKSGEAVSSTPKASDTDASAPKEKTSTPESKNVLPANMMPPDLSQMQPGNNMNMPMMPGFNPLMMNPMMMGMGMAGMAGMNPMNFMNPMMMNSGTMGMNFANPGQMPNWNMPVNMNMNMNMNQNQNPSTNLNQNRPSNFQNYNRPNRNPSFPQQPKLSAPQQPAGMTGVPTGPKALMNQNQNQNFYPPSGPAGNRFSNQQRHVGNEEDNAYMRQPVNPHRHVNRNRKPRQADYREL